MCSKNIILWYLIFSENKIIYILEFVNSLAVGKPISSRYLRKTNIRLMKFLRSKHSCLLILIVGIAFHLHIWLKSFPKGNFFFRVWNWNDGNMAENIYFFFGIKPSNTFNSLYLSFRYFLKRKKNLQRINNEWEILREKLTLFCVFCSLL